MSSANNTASAVKVSSVSTELDYMDGRLVRAGELSTEIIGTLNIPDPQSESAVPSEPRVTELDGRLGRIHDQTETLNRVISQLEYIAEEVHKV